MKTLKDIAFWIYLPFGLIYLLIISLFMKWDDAYEDYDPYD